MSKNVVINGVNYDGVSKVQLNTSDGVTALFQDVDEVATGGGSLESGTFVGDGTKNVTIPVSSKKNFLVITIDDNWRTNLADYPVQNIIMAFYDNEGAYGLNLRKYSSGDGLTNGRQDLSTSMEYRKPKFNDDSIEIVGGMTIENEPYIEGKTYKWFAR